MRGGAALTAPGAGGGTLARCIGAVVDASGRRPWVVLCAAIAVAAVAWSFAFRVLRRPRTDLRELLPTDSPGLVAFEHQLGRVGGGATLLVVVESNDRARTERFVDTLADRLEARDEPEVVRWVSYVERGTKEVHRFFEQNKWLYADVGDIDAAYETLDDQIALRSGLVADLGDGDGPRGDDAQGSRRPALGLAQYERDWKDKQAELDPFPSGYFEAAGGRLAGLRIVSKTTGMGDAGGDALLAAVERLAARTREDLHDPQVRFGFAGDIANAAAEKESVVGQAAWAGAAAFLLVVVGVVWFYRSAWAPVVIATPAVVGVGIAYAFAYARFGYVNTTGMFLGAIILGNGINYPIVLLSRYREFLGRGRSPADARREAVQNALRAELVGACVAAIAYGSLTTTEFRGFTQFGWIGFVGMLFVWIAMIPCFPALVVVIERARGPVFGAGRGPAGEARRGGWWKDWTERAPLAVLACVLVATGAAASSIGAFVRDPWEYNFDHLGSRASKKGGAGEWSNKAESVFGGKTNVAGALMLADTPSQVPELKAAILRNDAQDPQGSLIAGVATVDDYLPGAPAEQQRKLAALRRIRERLTPAVLASINEDERSRVEALRPPETLHVLGPEDLPPLLRRRFEESSGRVGTVFYVRYRSNVSLSDGRNLLRIARATDNVRLADGTTVQTASRATIFAEMIRSMQRDGPRATIASLVGVTLVVIVATRHPRGALTVLCSLGVAVAWLIGGAAALGEKLNYVNFITLPITFGIGCEYPFNVLDRVRLLGGDVAGALSRVGGAVALCSYTTMVGYGSLLFADFQALQSFGRLAVCGELACLTGALVVVPALLRSTVRLRE